MATSSDTPLLHARSDQSDSGGGSASYTYPNNDVYQSIGPAPTGEVTKDKQLEYDGAGRLTSVCEVLRASNKTPSRDPHKERQEAGLDAR